MLIVAWCLGVGSGVLGMLLAAYVTQRREAGRPLPEGCSARCAVCAAPFSVSLTPRVEGMPDDTPVTVGMEIKWPTAKAQN